KNPGRLQEVNREIEKLGVKVREQYAVLGPYDFVNVVDAPDTATIARVSIELGARGSVQITTLAAIPLDEFVGALES
ncbi:MAG TPA: GYD domain-containing protein, partial [Gemmatimonadota bacterium]|nr:GYD domain-containing protein [Gemmatimonadota bacterium]